MVRVQKYYDAYSESLGPANFGYVIMFGQFIKIFIEFLGNIKGHNVNQYY